MVFATAMVRFLPLRPASLSLSLSRAFRFRPLHPLPAFPPPRVPFLHSARAGRSVFASGHGFVGVRADSRRQEAGGRQRWRPGGNSHAEDATRCRAVSSSPSPLGKEVAVEVPVIVDEALAAGVDSFPLQAAIEQLELDAPLAVKLAIAGFEDFDRSDVVELSVLLCDDARIRELNKEWRQKDSATDVLSFPQDQPAGAPLLLLGDLVISVETAATQAEERGHSLIDELRILLVHGLLHVLDYDHELGPEASKEMEEEEDRILSALGWKVKGLIHASSVANPKPSKVFPSSDIDSDGDSGVIPNSKSQSKFTMLFCDMDGTLLNSKSVITRKTADALLATRDAGVTVVIATGKTRPAAMAALEPVGLSGERGLLSESTPGVFLQGLLVFGNNGKLIRSMTLDTAVVLETFQFSLEHKIPLVGFTGDRCVTLFPHPLIDSLHDVYYEPKAEVLESIEELQNVPIQKVIYLDSSERVANFLRPHWSLALRGGRATIVQALPEMMEILPPAASKGLGVQILLDHLGVPVDEVMALGDGENDIEMLMLAGWGVAMANGAARTLAVADAVTSSNDEDGVARAIEEYIL